MFYQLASREFRVPWEVLPPTDPEGGELLTLRRITENFYQAYERSYMALGNDGEEAVFGFSTTPGEAAVPPQPTSRPLESHPSHLEALTLRLTPERYRRLVCDLSHLLKAAAVDGLKDQGQVCTVAVLASRGALDAEGAFVGRTSWFCARAKTSRLTCKSVSQRAISAASMSLRLVSIRRRKSSDGRWLLQRKAEGFYSFVNSVCAELNPGRNRSASRYAAPAFAV
ncbi:hypothetical protein ACI3L1_03435 [Deinococcus sp. SM5_A1]|uniref:hypothetical protein n=1 Tax=Deinococcus sp. SM5_A1 TaxID=3379094 RepID=UPI00385E574C